MKKILEHLQAEWYKYLLEILVITFGILGAFALNNWNENRKEREEEQVLLESLLSDFQQNDTLIQVGISEYERNIYLTFRMLQQMGQVPDNYQKLVVDTLIVKGTGYSSLEIIISTLESVIDGNQLTKIQNQRLRKNLVEYPPYLKIYQEREALVRSITIDWIRPSIHKYLSLGKFQKYISLDTDFEEIPNRFGSDYKALLSDLELNNNYYNRYAQLKGTLRRLETLQIKNSVLIDQIQTELQDRFEAEIK